MIKKNLPLISSILFGIILSVLFSFVGVNSTNLQIQFFGFNNTTQVIRTSGSFSLFIYFFIILGVYKAFELVIKKGN